jgi:hypothetical protein
MKIKFNDMVVEKLNLLVNKEYEVIRTETERDDLFYIVLDETGKEQGIIDMLVEEIE